MTPTARARRRLASRTIPVAVHVPTQLPLALRWDHPIEAVHEASDPEPVEPINALRRRAAA